jgi:serine/threonine-protein kinase
VSITGGPAILIARLNDTELGGTWTPEGTIVFATTTGGLQRVSADGGEPVMFTRPDPEHGEAGHRWPEMLPGGHAVLCTVWPTTGGPDAASIAVLNLRGGRPTILVRGGSHAQYVTSGHLVYAAGGTLRAVRFDPTRPTLLGPSTTVVSQVRTTSVGAADVVVAQGTLAYVAGGAGDARRTLWWVDRQGRETPTGAAPRADYYPRLSPDGRRIVVQTLDHKSDIWIWELARAMWNRVTANPATNYTPVWMPDSRRVIFSSNQTGAQNLFVQDVDGRAAERLTTSPNVQTPTAVSDDGTWLVFDERFPKTGTDVMALRLDGTHQVRPLVQTPFDDRNGIVSPNGRWLAYEADDTGLFEVYVKPFPDVDSGRWQVSMNGGTRPVWARDGRELFYLAQDGAVMRVAVTGGPTWTGGLPTKVLDGRYLASLGGNYQRNYDIAPDGRFLMMKEGISDATGVPPQIVVVENFDEELKRLMPTK